VLTALGLLVLASSYFVSQTLNEWFERDLAGRADLALAGARDKLVEYWSGTSTTRMTALLTALTHDERLIAAAACSRTGSLLAATTEWPTEVSCTTIARHVRPTAGAPASEWTTWRSGVQMEGGPAHVSALPLIDHVVDLQFAYFADSHPASVAAPLDGAGNCAYGAGDPPPPLLAALGAGTIVELPLARLTDGPYCGVAPNRFDADLLRIRRVRVTLRLQAANGRLRDLEVTFHVAPRNMVAGR